MNITNKYFTIVTWATSGSLNNPNEGYHEHLLIKIGIKRILAVTRKKLWKIF